MKKITSIFILMSFTYFGFSQHEHTPMQNNIDSMSYAVGMNIASSLKQGGIDSLNYEIFVQALNDVLVENHVIMDAQVAQKVVRDYVTEIKEEGSKEVIAAGENFLKENATKPGVMTTPSGLQYSIITNGTGAVPTDGNKVKTHYHGTLIDGSIFDSSIDRGEPAVFGVNQVIRGWTEALKMMPVGSKWRLYIPHQLAYGDRAMGAKIPPYSTLIFDIELLEIVE